MEIYNLVSASWIPVHTADGQPRLVSLIEIFTRRDLVDLAVRPHERVALMRLFICAAQAAAETPEYLDSPEAEWDAFQESLTSLVPAYLEKHRTAFTLLGDGPRFLQLRTAKTDTTTGSKLFFELASGNNATLFDHAGGEDRAFDPARLALALLTFQNFSPLIGRGYTGRGPCVVRSALHVFRTGPTLLDTIALNCLPQVLHPEPGRPIWEMMPQRVTTADKDAAVKNATQTYLGRLVPLTRALWLSDDGREFILDNGLAYPEFHAMREPSTTEGVARGKTGDEARYLLGTNPDRAVWRDLPAIAAWKRNIDAGECGPLALLREMHGQVDLWAGGLAADQAKIIDAVQSVFSGERALPAGLFGSDDRARIAWRGALDAAETWEYSLRNAVKAYAEVFKLDSKAVVGMRERAVRYFWDRVEKSLPDLTRLAVNPSEAGEKAVSHPYAPTRWHQAVQRAAAAAFRAVCPSETARQIEAFGTAVGRLWPKDPDKAKPATTRARKTQSAA